MFLDDRDGKSEILIGYYFENFKFEDKCILINFHWVKDIIFNEYFYLRFREIDSDEVWMSRDATADSSYKNVRLCNQSIAFIMENINSMSNSKSVHNYFDFFHGYTLMISKDEYVDIFN